MGGAAEWEQQLGRQHVHDTDPNPSADEIDADRVVESVEQLLDACRCGTLDDLESLIDDLIDAEVRVCGEGRPGRRGDGDIEVYLHGPARSTIHLFPFAVRELFHNASDIDQVWRFDMELEGLAESIEMIEGFTVELEINPSATVPDRLQRRMSGEGRLVQWIIPYPYQRRMTGTATLDEWFARRVLRHNPGLRLVGYERRRDRLVTLAELRDPSPARRPRHQ